MRSGRAADLALLVSVFTITLVRLRWPVGGNDVYLSDFTVAAFLVLFLVHRLVALRVEGVGDERGEAHPAHGGQCHLRISRSMALMRSISIR